MEPEPLPPRLGANNPQDLLHHSSVRHDARLLPAKMNGHAVPATHGPAAQPRESLARFTKPVATPSDAIAGRVNSWNTESLQNSAAFAGDSLNTLAISPNHHPAPPTTRVPQHSFLTSSSNSQDSNGTADTDQIFSPPASDGEMSGGNDNASSQGSQLFQLSQAAALQDRMAHGGTSGDTPASRKRMADGHVKATEDRNSVSPVRSGHSRNTSTVSMASTSGSRIGELSAELRARLSYAMVKVNHGWQSHSIDEVESMASQAVSPTSSNSTIPRRPESSTSPALSLGSKKTASPIVMSVSQPLPSGEPLPRDVAAYSSSQPHSVLAPPATIQPSQAKVRRNSKPNYTPTLLSHSHSSSPQTPAQPSARLTPGQLATNTPVVDPILFSPHQNVREQDAIETLIFMRSPGNSANLKHAYSPNASPQGSSLRTSQTHTQTQRHALPTSQPRKSLPSHRPHSTKRVGFEKSPGTAPDMDMDVDSPQLGSPHSVRSNTRRRAGVNGNHVPSPTFKGVLGLPTALGGGTTRRRTVLADEDIERMLERVAQGEGDSSEDEAEIQIPPSRRRHSNAIHS